MSVGRSYARALIEDLADGENLSAEQLKRVDSALRFCVEAYEVSAQLRQALKAPGIRMEEKASLLAQVVARSEEGREALPAKAKLLRFLEITLQKGRIGHLASICEAFSRLRLSRVGGELGVVESAEPLTDSDISELSRSFSKKLGCPVELVSKVDADLLAGLRVTLRGFTYDGTLKAQLAGLKERVVFGTSMFH